MQLIKGFLLGMMVFLLTGFTLFAGGYLPLNGGTLTGNIIFPQTANCAATALGFTNNLGTGLTYGGTNTFDLCGGGANVLDITNNGAFTANNGMGLGKTVTGVTGNGWSRIYMSGGTALITGDFGSIAAACGATASITAVSGDDSRGTFTLASAGVGQVANTCTVTLTFHDGTFTAAPFVVAGVVGTLPAVPVAINVLSTSATTVVFEVIGTVVAASSYTFGFITEG